MSAFSYDPRQVITIYRPQRSRMGTETVRDEEYIQTASCMFYEGTPKVLNADPIARIVQRRGAAICRDKTVDVQMGDSVKLTDGTWFAVTEPPSYAAGVAFFLEQRPLHE